MEFDVFCIFNSYVFPKIQSIIRFSSEKGFVLSIWQAIICTDDALVIVHISWEILFVILSNQ